MVLQLHTLWSVVREINIPELRRELELPLRIAVVGRPTAERGAVVRLLGGTEAAFIREVDTATVGREDNALWSADLVVVVGPPDGPTPDERAALEWAVRGQAPTVLIIAGHGIQPAGGPTGRQPGGVAAVLDIDIDHTDLAQQRLAATLLDLLGTRSLALARAAPGLREPLAGRLIHDTSLANAQFALLSTLPAWIPLIGGLAGSAADLFVLTKNQVLLVFKLAGMYGHDLNQWRRILIEIAPVVGGAFVWRSVARVLVGLLPTPISAVPKTTVAYVGTATVGEIARRYYRDGVRANAAAVREIQQGALRRVQAAMKRRPTSSA